MGFQVQLSDRSPQTWTSSPGPRSSPSGLLVFPTSSGSLFFRERLTSPSGRRAALPLNPTSWIFICHFTTLQHSSKQNRTQEGPLRDRHDIRPGTGPSPVFRRCRLLKSQPYKYEILRREVMIFRLYSLWHGEVRSV